MSKKVKCNIHHLHGVPKFLQLSIFALTYQLQGADELRDCAVQPGKQLC